jgi:hypothetical protein
MDKKTTDHTLSRLAHPGFILALGIILLNALVLQPLSPSWLTGKVADLAWMVVLPVAVASLLSLIWQKQEKMTFWIASVAISLVFILVKTLPEVNFFVRALFHGLFNLPLKLALDPSDLIGLVGVILAAWIWNHPWRIPHLAWRFAPLILLVMAGLADAVDPGYDQIECLAVDGPALVAFTPERSKAYFGDASERKAYISRDNGQTWADMGTFSPDAEDETGVLEGIEVAVLSRECQDWNQQMLVEDPLNPRVQYIIVSERGVYRSWDGGETLSREYRVDEGVVFEDAVFAPDNRTLAIAASYYGVLLRLPDGGYLWADPSGRSLAPGE